MDPSKNTADIFATGDTIKTPKVGSPTSPGFAFTPERKSRTRAVMQFLAPPRVRKIGFWVLCFMISIVFLLHLSDWTGDWARAWWEWFWNDVWNSVGLVPFFIGGLLFRALWPIREDGKSAGSS